ncbi:MAG: endonuclease/exonuclease/phosphatase family protein [Desulfobulbus sp.]|nr:endonuclease/exonuclease/phosphatase family protein [Desulfobulbus sp.]
MIRVMSFNVRYGLADDGENHWNNRKDLALERIQAFDPDLLGLQECRDDHQAGFLRDHLIGHRFYGVHRGGPGETALEMAPLFFRRKSFHLVDSGCFWLSETPETPGSRSWKSNYPRTVSWVRLGCPESGRELVYANTHFDYEPEAIIGDARCLKQWLEQLGRDTPLILSGDFNAEKDSAAYQLLTTNLCDAYHQMHPQSADESTYHAFGHPELRETIDWVLVSEHFQVLAAEIDRTHKGNLFPSDHYPLTAVLDWKAA